MNIIIYMGHPAHFHLFRPVITILRQKKHNVKILIKKKDILEYLLKKAGWDYENILPKGRRDDKLSIALGMLKRNIQLFHIAKKYRPAIMLGTSAEIAHIGKLLGIPSIVVNEDDFDVVPLFSKLAYPFAHAILAPQSCKTGKWANKTIFYNGYHEIAYLHPDYFQPDKSKVAALVQDKNRFFILRFAKLTAHHDSGRKGIDRQLTEKIIELLRPLGRIFITSERTLEDEFEPYRISIDPYDMHHALYYADLYIGDSQTMAAEAAVLGTPSLRFNDFVGEIGYLEELEHQYALTFGFKTSEADKLILKLKEILNDDNSKQIWNKRKNVMLKDKINVTSFFISVIENFPEKLNELYRNKQNKKIYFL